MKRAQHILILSLLPAMSLAAQTPEVSNSTVYGRVICTDTNQPARFGKVLLKSTQGGGLGDDIDRRLEKMFDKPDAKSGTPKPAPTEEQKRLKAASTHNMNRAADQLNASTIGLDGKYSFAHVKPGTYYVHVVFPGYVDPFNQFSDNDLASTDPDMRARIASSMPTVTVSGSDSAMIDLRIDHGASVVGRLTFDDGSPASGWMVSIDHPEKKNEYDPEATAMAQALSQNGNTEIAKTDDLGNYRIAGLAPGKYAIRATFNATGLGISAMNIGESGTGLSLAVYSGGVFRRADEKSFTLTAGENRVGVDFIVPSHKLHNITGHVYAKADNHPLNSGQVSLRSKDDEVFHFRAAIRDDGSFHYDYLPPGTYTVKVESAADVQTTGTSTFLGMSIPKQDTLRKYGADSTDVTLADTDIDTVNFTVAQTDWTPPAKKPGSDVDPGAALGSLLGGLLGGDSKETKPNPK